MKGSPRRRSTALLLPIVIAVLTMVGVSLSSFLYVGAAEPENPARPSQSAQIDSITFTVKDVVEPAQYGSADETECRWPSRFPEHPELWEPMPLLERTEPANRTQCDGRLGPCRAKTEQQDTCAMARESVPLAVRVRGGTEDGLAFGEGIEQDGRTPMNFTDLYLVTDQEVYPWRVNVKLFTTLGGVGYVGSGVLIDPKHVLTAGHCVHQGGGGSYATEVVVAPAYENGVRPYGDASKVGLRAWPEWRQESSWDHDIGLVTLDRPVGALTGWHTYWYNDDPSFYYDNTFHNPGYPAESPYNGQYMYSWYGSYDFTDSLLGIWYGNEVGIDSRAYGGQSGSGAYYIHPDWGRTVYAVLSSGDSSHTYFPRLTSDKVADINSWIAADTPSTVDLMPLDVNTSPATITAGDQISSMDYLVHNYSSASWNGRVDVTVYLSSDNNITTGDTPIQSHYFDCTIGSKLSVRLTGPGPVIPLGTAEDDYYIGVILDISDYDTGNNDSDGWDASPIHVNEGPLIQWNHDSYDFGDTCIGSPSTYYAIRLQNTGGATATGTVSLSGGDSSQFDIVSGGGSFSLAPGEEKAVHVSFAPTSVGAKSTTLFADGTNCNDDSCPLYGNGIQCPEIRLTPASHDFGSVQVGQCSSTYSFTLQNVGGGTATGSVSLTGSDASQFMITSGSGSFSLGAGATKPISVKFCPSSETSKSATLYADGSNCNDDSSSLSGTGVLSPQIELTPSSYDFGSVQVGQCSSTYSFTLQNIGGGTATGSVDLAVGAEFIITSGSGSFSLGAGATKPISVKFCPISVGAKNDALLADGSNCNDDSSSLSGTGVLSPQIQLTPSSHDFGSVQVGQCSSTYSFTLQNVGGGTATGSVSLTGSDASQFMITSGSGSFSLGAGATKPISVKFCPSYETSKSATLFADGSNCNDDSSSLSGTGVLSPQIELTPPSHDLGSVQVGQCSSSYPFTLENVGGGTATGTVSLTGANADQFTITSGSGSFSLGPRATKTINVQFCPASETSKSATLFADGSNCNDDSALLSGTGIDIGAWSVPLIAETVQPQMVGGSNPSLEFGVREGATDGYDSGVDVPHTPPAPGANFDAYFQIDDPTFDELDKDFRAPGETIEWALRVWSTSDDIQITWDASGVPQDKPVHMYTPAGPIDMKAQSSTTIDGPGDYTIPIMTGMVCVEIPLKAGWNMVSVPVIPEDPSAASVFPGAEAVCAWDRVNQTYVSPPAQIEPDHGYWVAVIQDTAVEVCGTPVTGWTTDIVSPWNIIGSVIDDAPIADWSDDPDGNMEPYAWWWNPTTRIYEFFTLPTTIDSTKGYWIAATGDCSLTLP